MSLPLIKKTVLNHNTRIFRFGLPEGKTTGLPVGQHLRIHANVNGKDIFRHYTPISTNKGTVIFTLQIGIMGVPT